MAKKWIELKSPARKFCDGLLEHICDSLLMISITFFPDSYMINKSLPWDYDFKFVVEEISNVNDKAQVSNFFSMLANIEKKGDLQFHEKKFFKCDPC